MIRTLTAILFLSALCTLPVHAENIEGHEVPSIEDMKDGNMPYGLNLDKVNERIKILRPKGVSNDPSYTVSLYQSDLGRIHLISNVLPRLENDLKRLRETQIKPLTEELVALEKERKSSLLKRLKSKVNANPRMAEAQMHLSTLKEAESILERDIAYIKPQAPSLPLLEEALLEKQAKLTGIFGLNASQVKALPHIKIKMPSGQME